VTIIETVAKSTLRDRKKAAIMRRVQEIAVERFAERGFAGVTVEEIAAAAEVAPATVYRHFGTKERLVLWDEFDPPILEAIARRLPSEPPLDAVRDALGTLLDEVYDREAPLALARATLIEQEPSLLAAAALDSRGFAAAIAALFHESGTPEFEAHVLAEIAVAALAASVTEWQRRAGKTPLRELVNASFATLAAGEI
jgi:AcrR family transcriptional regulator